MQTQISKSKLRSFGLIVGAVFLLMGVWPALRRGQDVRWAASIAGIALLTLGTFMPSLLRWPYKIWMQLASVLAWINTKIILSVLFFVVFTPAALIMRLIGKDPMSRAFISGAETYRVPCQRRSITHMRHQF